jgi:formylglycine-generating enzyme required for sulfatase activity
MDLHQIVALLADRVSSLCIVRDEGERLNTYQALMHRLDARTPLDVRLHSPKAIETRHGAVVRIVTFPEALADCGGLTDCHVPAGSFWMGLDDSYDDEAPVLRHTVAAFWMTSFPITVRLYALAVQSGVLRHPNGAYGSSWDDQRLHPMHPVTQVSQEEAEIFAAWLGKMMGQPWRLPTEIEWEYAGRGTDQRLYPWGNASTAWRANVSDQVGDGDNDEEDENEEDALPATALEAVGLRPDNVSPFGIADLLGNCDEWTSAAYHCYGEVPPSPTERMVIRGGSYDTPLGTLCYRGTANRSEHRPTLGFRLVRSW